MEPVRSPQNAKVVAANRLHHARERRKSGLTLIEGPHLLDEAVAAGAEVLRVFVLPDGVGEVDAAVAAGAELTVVDSVVLNRLAGTESPRGPVAVVRIPEPGGVTRDAVVLSVTDPGNAGTIIRTAAAFGFDVVADASVDLWSPKVLRAGAGAHFRTGFGVAGPEPAIATVVTGGIGPGELASVLDPGRTWSVLIGSEPHGLSPDAIDRAAFKVTIPMARQIESLNAAVAAGIVMYEIAQWRARHDRPLIERR